ncbi:MAG: carboxypeptidase regulatory-like domain-containing protein [Pedobacter sp.]|nr:MAG: carboxypeptidase regulatory-like domain-containing protein [Pedobacter sp.]
MLKKLLLLAIFVGSFAVASAQRATIKGIVADTTEKRRLVNSAILLIRNTDSVLVRSIRADENGAFEFTKVPKGRYQVIVTYPKMADYIANLNLSDSSKIDLRTINMELQSKIIEEVVIRAQKDAIRVKGDTITYQADSFKVTAGANVQELLKRLPGFEIGEDGSIKAQGKAE